MPQSIASLRPSGPPVAPFRRELQRHRALVAGLATLAIASLLFLIAPDLDLAASRLFYQPAAGFSDAGSQLLEGIRNVGTMVEWAFLLFMMAPLLIKLAVPKGRLLLPPRATLFVLATFALGPGLIVNGVLKEHWGRARPREIIEFGGGAAFSPAWRISDQCQGNCSFVSGEAAAAFALFAVVFLLRKELRPAAALVTLAFAAMVSFTRIAVGAHFLSDVLLAWLMTFCVILALDRAILMGLPSAFDGIVEDAVERMGESLRRLFSRRPFRGFGGL